MTCWVIARRNDDVRDSTSTTDNWAKQGWYVPFKHIIVKVVHDQSVFGCTLYQADNIRPNSLCECAYGKFKFKCTDTDILCFQYVIIYDNIST